MPDSENRKPVPTEEIAAEKPPFFRDYFIIQGNEDPTTQVGVFELEVEETVLADWKKDLRACIRNRAPNVRFISQSPDPETQTQKFIVGRKKEVGASVQLRGLQGLETPVTMVLKGDSARIYFPLSFQTADEDPKTVVEQLGPAYWAALPRRIKEYHDKQPPPKTVYKGGKTVSKKEKRPLKIDTAIMSRIEDVLINRFDGDASPEQLRIAYERAFRETLPPSIQNQLSEIIHRLKN